MRVVAGSLRGRRLVAPPGRDVRPTADRVREALFSAIGDDLPEAVVLDLYAGTGALAIEALSRGAASATLVESDRSAAAAIQQNLQSLDLVDRAVVRIADASRWAARPSPAGPYTLVFADPPYDLPLGDVHAVLAALHDGGAIAPFALIVVERGRRDPDLDAPPPRFLRSEARRSYGDTVLIRLRAAATPPDVRGDPGGDA